MTDLICNNPEDHQKPESIDRIAIFGFADALREEPLYQEVWNTTKCLAELGYTIVDGGGPGVMRAATEGAKKGQGQVIGVTFYPKDAMNFEGKDPYNLVDEEIVTHNYVARTITLLQQGQVYVIFNGGTGTISEFAMAWGLARLYFGHHKPLVLYGDFWPKIIDSFKDHMRIRPEELRVFKYATSPHEVIKAITEFGREIKAGIHPHIKVGVDGEGAFIL